jgi:hypothetical protein
VWAGGSVSRGIHRLKLHGAGAMCGTLRLRAPPGLTMVVRGPLSLKGPLTAHVASSGGVGAGDEWLAEGVLRCALAARADGGEGGGQGGGEGGGQGGGEGGGQGGGEGDAAGSAVDVSDRPPPTPGSLSPPTAGVIMGTYCELHGASASDEVQRAHGEAAGLELADGAQLDLEEGSALWVDGSAGVAPPAGQQRASVRVSKGGRLELFGRAELSLSGEAALEPVPPRVLAQVVHS